MKVIYLGAFVMLAVVGASCSSNLQPAPDLPTEPAQNQGADSATETPLLTTDYSEYEIITLLPKDAIQAIDNPTFLSVAEAELEYAPDEFVMGVEFNGEARAYSVSHLSRHEIVNDTVGGVAIAVTW